MKFGFGKYKNVEIDEIFNWTKEHKQRNKEITKLVDELEKEGKAIGIYKDKNKSITKEQIR